MNWGMTGLTSWDWRFRLRMMLMKLNWNSWEYIFAQFLKLVRVSFEWVTKFDCTFLIDCKNEESNPGTNFYNMTVHRDSNVPHGRVISNRLWIKAWYSVLYSELSESGYADGVLLLSKYLEKFQVFPNPLNDCLGCFSNIIMYGAVAVLDLAPKEPCSFRRGVGYSRQVVQYRMNCCRIYRKFD